MNRSPLARRLIPVLAVLLFLFLYAPLAVLGAFSFQKSPILSWPIDEWSLRWYAALLQNSQLIDAIKNSLIVALSCVAVTSVGGVWLALILHRFRPSVALFMERTILLTLIVPQLITGLAFLLIFNRTGMQLSLLTVIIGQSAVWMPLMVTQVHVRLRALPPELRQAAMDLGATPFQAFWYITLPSIATTVTGSALLVFILSFDELPVTFFLTGAQNTLPMYIWSMLRTGITPEINAVATLTIGVSILLVALGLHLLVKSSNRKEEQ